jgi:hypothetical protein
MKLAGHEAGEAPEGHKLWHASFAASLASVSPDRAGFIAASGALCRRSQGLLLVRPDHGGRELSNGDREPCRYRTSNQEARRRHNGPDAARANQNVSSELNRVVITAVNAVCRVRHYAEHGFALLEVFDDVGLGALHQRAESFGLWTQPTWATLVSLILDRLRAALSALEKRARPKARSEPKPPRSITRVPEVQAKLDLVKRLPALQESTPKVMRRSAAGRACTVERGLPMVY